jgi:hypothetical protein
MCKAREELLVHSVLGKKGVGIKRGKRHFIDVFHRRDSVTPRSGGSHAAPDAPRHGRSGPSCPATGEQQAAGVLRRRSLRLCLRWLGEVVEAEGCTVHGYALTTNHVHLMLTLKRAESIHV